MESSASPIPLRPIPRTADARIAWTEDFRQALIADAREVRRYYASLGYDVARIDQHLAEYAGWLSSMIRLAVQDAAIQEFVEWVEAYGEAA